MLCFFTPSHLKVKVKTWSKNSYDLFDYQATDVCSQTYKVHDSSKIQWINKTGTLSIEQNSRNKPLNEKDDNKVNVGLFGYIQCSSPTRKSKNKNFLFHPRITQNIALAELFQSSSLTNDKQNFKKNSTPYIVVKKHVDQSTENSYKLNLGSVIRLGLVQFKVIEIYNKKSQQSTSISGNLQHFKSRKSLQQTMIISKDRILDCSSKSDKENRFNQQSSYSLYTDETILNVKQATQGSCKFCLQSQQEYLNPLISPCKCSGSCSAVHMECLKSWINTKVKRETYGVVSSFNFQKFQCQICKEPYPTLMSYKNQTIHLVQIQKPEKPYIVLESTILKTRGQNFKRKSIHILSPQNNEIKIGRSENCELCIQDKTISRIHSSISFKNESFYISDCGSKFGTLVKLQHSIKLKEKVTLQIARSVLELIPK